MLAALVRATHPEPAAAVTGAAALLALAVGHPFRSAALVTATIAASQLAVGWANDAVDAGRDRAVGRADKPIAAGAVSARTVALCAVGATAVTVALAATFPPPATGVALIGLASALAYNWPLKRTPVSVLPYAVSFAALPSFVVLSLPAPLPWWLPVAGALLGAGAHFANVLPDLADDAATGVRGLPHRLGAGPSTITAGGLLLAAAATLVWGPSGSPTWWQLSALAAAVVVLPVGWAAARGALLDGRRPTALFRAFLVVAVINVALLFGGGTLT